MKEFDADGRLVKHKARLVAQGYTQKYGVNFTQTYAPVVNAASLRLLLAISANKGYHIDSLDITTAFLNGDIDGDVYMSTSLRVLSTQTIPTRWGSSIRPCMDSNRAHTYCTYSCMTILSLRVSGGVAMSLVSMFDVTALVVSSWLLCTLMIWLFRAVALLLSLPLSTLWPLSFITIATWLL